MTSGKGNRMCHEGWGEVKERFKDKVAFEQTPEGRERQVIGYLGEEERVPERTACAKVLMWEWFWWCWGP